LTEKKLAVKVDFEERAWASTGEGKRGYLPPLTGKNSMFFFTFLKENSMFLGIFGANSMFLTPFGKFCPPLKKSMWTPMGTSSMSIEN